MLAAAFGLAALLAAGCAGAAPRNPELMGRAYFGDDEHAQPRRALRIGRLAVEVDVLGGMARTVVTAHLANPGEEALEGDFVLELPAGSVVTGYALDVEGKMVEGVLEAPRKAKLAYETEVRRGIDPGLAEVTRENAFRTRVFPIREQVGRTVRVAFATPFDAAAPYRLPLNLPEAADEVSVTVRAPEPDLRLAVGGDLPLDFRTGDGGRETTAVLRRRALSGVLELRPPAVRTRVTASRHATGEVFLDVQDEAPATAAAPARVRLYWDTSRSRTDDDLKGEIALVRRWLEQARPAAVDLVLLSDQPAVVESLQPDAEAVARRLAQATYRGATSYGGLAAPVGAADICLLASDGRPTIDGFAPADLGCRLFTLSSAGDADRGLLAAFARASGGEHLDLAARARRDLLAPLLAGGSAVSGVSDGSGRAVAYALVPARRGRFRVVAPAAGELRVRLANGEARSYRGPSAAPHDAAGAVWAGSQVAMLAARARPEPVGVLALSRRYGVASAQASFVVFETTSQWARAGVQPPSTLGPEFLKEYAEAREEIAQEAREARQGRLGEVVDSWAAQKAWWSTNFDPRARPAKRRPQAPGREAVEIPSIPPLPAPPVSRPPAGGGGDSEIHEVVVTSSRREPEGPEITLNVTPWNPDRPYLTALRAAPAGRFWSVAEAEAKAHGGMPAFWLDVAELLFRTGRAEEARRVVLEALEVPAADTATLSVVAERLRRYGDEPRALWLLEEVAFREPDRPQPLRNLALALADRAERPGVSTEARLGDHQRALELLAEVILKPWNGDYDGIELVALMEANRVIAKLQGLGVAQTRLDPRLVALLDVDLRVVLEWNTDATDMDLWVDEPNGERAFYSNPKTAIGGRLSNDMTGGYGPEEYLLRRAPDGKFEVRVDVYATDRLNPNGATTVRATLFRNWGRANEAREALEIELKGDEDEALVGQVQVRGGR
jgi:hypothetical protein